LAVGREIIGVVLIALTASTIVTMFIIGERSEQLVEVLENKHPMEIRHDQSNTFSLAIIARKPIEFVDIEVSSLHSLDISEMDIEMTKKGRDAMIALPEVSTLINLSQSLGIEPEEYAMEIVRNKTTHDMYVFDFTDVLAHIDESVVAGYSLYGTTTLFAGLFNETGMAYLYTGFRDFFAKRNSTITELSITYNDEKDVYKRLKELSPQELQEGVPDLLDAPPLGRVAFSEIAKDDTMRLAFSVDRSSIPVEYLDGIELIEILANGDTEKRIANHFLST